MVVKYFDSSDSEILNLIKNLNNINLDFFHFGFIELDNFSIKALILCIQCENNTCIQSIYIYKNIKNCLLFLEQYCISNNFSEIKIYFKINIDLIHFYNSLDFQITKSIKNDFIEMSKLLL